MDQCRRWPGAQAWVNELDPRGTRSYDPEAVGSARPRSPEHLGQRHVRRPDPDCWTRPQRILTDVSGRERSGRVGAIGRNGPGPPIQALLVPLARQLDPSPDPVGQTRVHARPRRFTQQNRHNASPAWPVPFSGWGSGNRDPIPEDVAQGNPGPPGHVTEAPRRLSRRSRSLSAFCCRMMAAWMSAGGGEMEPRGSGRGKDDPAEGCPAESPIFSIRSVYAIPCF